MARMDVEYVDPENPSEMLDVKIGGLRFGGHLMERKIGGFDLYLSLEYSDCDAMTQEQFNLLYDRAGASQEVFIEHFSHAKLSRSLTSEAKERLKRWLQGVLGVT